VKIVYFAHSLVSCWNHGNAHFLRGLLRALITRGHTVQACEPADGWSRRHLAEEIGEDPARRFRSRFPDLDVVATHRTQRDVEALVHGADLVIVHEWNDPRLVAALGQMKARGSARFVLLFHDTHHRAVSNPDEIGALPLDGYDGILAFGRSLADIYRRAGWGTRAFVLHEAADTAHFFPLPSPDRRGAVWIGNWGDGERSEEIAEYLLKPAAAAGVPLDIYGVRYPDTVIQLLRARGASYRGWLPNDEAPRIFSRHLFTVHVPRRYYASLLPGIPTIRVFEALACGIPLLSAPWQDAEGLFRIGTDFLMARSEQEMTRGMRDLSADADLRRALAERGLATIRQRHTCLHRADQLMSIVKQVGPRLEGAA
jgi:spore maturation protein CgeB